MDDELEAGLMHAAPKQAMAVQPDEHLRLVESTVADLYNNKRMELSDTNGRHEIERATLMSDYRRRMDDLRHKAGEALRELVEKQRREVEPLARLVDRLEAMRR